MVINSTLKNSENLRLILIKKYYLILNNHIKYTCKAMDTYCFTSVFVVIV